MSLRCGLILILSSTICLFIANGYGKDISGVERGSTRLNEYISHYETLSYDQEHTKASHSRAKRSVTKDHLVYLKFSAHGKKFHLRLKRDLDTFSDKLEIHSSTNEPIDVSTSHIYAGDVIGERKSFVFGSILDGVFEGKIITERDAYYVENAKHYFPNHTYKTDGFHSIIYNEKHVDDPYKDVREEGHVAGCGINEKVSQWMENIQNSAVEEPDEVIVLPPASQQKANIRTQKNDRNKQSEERRRNKSQNSPSRSNSSSHHQPSSSRSTSTSPSAPSSSDDTHDDDGTHHAKQIPPPKKYSNSNNNDDFKYPYQKYTKEANWKFMPNGEDDGYARAAAAIAGNDDWHKRVHERVRRASSSNSHSPRQRDDKKNTCSLFIQTDPLIWRHIREGIADHDRGRITDEKTREEILSLIAHHVTAVNYIYRNTKFDGKVEHRNIRFEVQRIKIDDDTACRQFYNGPHNAFCNEHMDVSNFLNLHSLEDHSTFCLAYVFTYRDFTGGTLGLAWVASASGASGGICEKYKTYTETVGGQYQSTKRSLNTGIITFVNYNSRVPPKVSQLTLAHEIGHNFGSPHDYPDGCRPGGPNGNYIMFASATSGDRPNNSKFSPCSVRNISNVLDVLVGNPKRDCFEVSEGAFCGNKIVESGEECDCGFNEEECNDKCCYPRLINEYDKSINASATGCSRRTKTQCSPSQGPCCLSHSCTFVPAHQHIKCKEETECSWSSTCNGTTPECPEPKPRDNKTKCNNGTALCINGECSGSICLLWNMSECFLTSTLTPAVDKRRLCELACQNGNDTTTCRSTSEFAHLYGLPDGGINLRPGSPCDNFQGYCDVFLKCRAVDADGPLVRLKNLLLNKETLLTVAQWVTENWYICVLMAIGFIIVMGAFIKCCAVHTPSSNPKKRPARRISETLRGPMNTLRRMRHPQHRSAGPRSIPPPAHERSRGHPSDWDRRQHPDRSAPPGGVPIGHHPSRPGARNDGRRGGAPSAGGRHSGRPASSSRGPQHGYADLSGGGVGVGVGVGGGDGRGPSQPPQQYYPPKAVGPQQVNYNRPPSLHNPELYAEAYTGRGAYEAPPSRVPNSKV
ncbi:disintegrin and metalloproteinase domain-containing protein 10 isoform X1 [Eupeodes corollae]|uniref:disintegrin and metalloproteinase domain-containing protein 10 isoform X1 n=1 Tax=Eupeodes corollae TaxID=290404 RepID=UPI0024917AE2|nr:disintegrin and metalloproteinase domain-containing protein 10 isoform X1 [Eupeodes corollae]XP_055907030.1 disintegrin and metalloproteinase domain-containing protein 10 isoform X1 [Eupeodes corollae]XP_055907031.1 disintegrin and metalloproteinase domain-containing protein 10 isoform X1 [Eupeodes corollae]